MRRPSSFAARASQLQAATTGAVPTTRHTRIRATSTEPPLPPPASATSCFRGPKPTVDLTLPETAAQLFPATPPSRVFVVPYRNRLQHKFFFSRHMTYLLEDQEDYLVVFVHQCDARTFNRGAIKNLGFMAVKQRYPDDYANMTFVFNDVDTMPFDKLFEYQTVRGVAMHYYGFRHALGGIVAMKGCDFERINGFPCYWGWGMEDNVLQARCQRAGILINRDQFYSIGSPEILQLFDGVARIITKVDPLANRSEDVQDGLSTLTGGEYVWSDQSENPADNQHVWANPRMVYVNVHDFQTRLPYDESAHVSRDLRTMTVSTGASASASTGTAGIYAHTGVVHSSEWSHIPSIDVSLHHQLQSRVDQYVHQGRPLPKDLQAAVQQCSEMNRQLDPFALPSARSPPPPPPPSVSPRRPVRAGRSASIASRPASTATKTSATSRSSTTATRQGPPTIWWR